MKDLTNEQKQTLLSGILGDGYLIKNGGGAMSFSCIHKEYLELKKELLGDLATEVKAVNNNGYKKGIIYTLRAKASDYGKTLMSYTIEDIMKEIDSLGLAMWFFDDSSRHKSQNFYNINTHAIDLEIQKSVLIPYLEKWGIFARIMPERKKDGRVFHYLFVSKNTGAFEMNNIMEALPIECFKYKLWSTGFKNAYIIAKEKCIDCDKRGGYKRSQMINNILIAEKSKLTK